jgi:hypothetical protein
MLFSKLVFAAAASAGALVHAAVIGVRTQKYSPSLSTLITNAAYTRASPRPDPPVGAIKRTRHPSRGPYPGAWGGRHRLWAPRHPR